MKKALSIGAAQATQRNGKCNRSRYGEGTELYSVDQFTGDIGEYDKIAFGCPAMGDEVLEEGEFDPFFSSIEGKLGGKKVALFGSYGWGDGQWMRGLGRKKQQKQARTCMTMV